MKLELSGLLLCMVLVSGCGPDPRSFAECGDVDWDQVEATLITLHGRMSQAGLIGLTLHDGIPFGALNDMDVRGLPKEATLDSTILNILPELEVIEFRVAWLDPVTGEFSMSGDPLCGGGEVPNTTYTVSLDPLGIYRDRVS